MDKAIQKAIEGGWNTNFTFVRFTKTGGVMFQVEGYFQAHRMAAATIFLDPLFWQALGKSLGWGMFIDCQKCHGYNNWKNTECPSCGSKEIKLRTDGVGNYRDMWHRFIDALIEGKSADDFFNNLLK